MPMGQVVLKSEIQLKCLRLLITSCFRCALRIHTKSERQFLTLDTAVRLDFSWYLMQLP